MTPLWWFLALIAQREKMETGKNFRKTKMNRQLLLIGKNFLRLAPSLLCSS
jgi:hypothetical protein